MNGPLISQGLRLTKREKEILQYIADGMRSTQIAEKLSISEYTVANHRKNIIKKKGYSTKQLTRGTLNFFLR